MHKLCSKLCSVCKRLKQSKDSVEPEKKSSNKEGNLYDSVKNNEQTVT